MYTLPPTGTHVLRFRLTRKLLQASTLERVEPPNGHLQFIVCEIFITLFLVVTVRGWCTGTLYIYHNGETTRLQVVPYNFYVFVNCL